jgi:excisionase family DNA binding protein
VSRGSDEGFVSPAQVAARSSLSVKTVYRAIQAGRLLAHQPTAKYLISEAAYQAWVSRPRALRTAGSALPPRPSLAPEAGTSAELLAIESEVA